MQTLIYEYKQSLRELRKMRQALEEKTVLSAEDERDKKIIGGMISEMEFTIQWLVSGRNPGQLKGAERTGVYATVDPKILEAIVPNQEQMEERVITKEEKAMLEEMLSPLTKRERDVFTLIRAEGHSHDKTAVLLGITKSSVQTFLNRAEKKIQARKEGKPVTKAEAKKQERTQKLSLVLKEHPQANQKTLAELTGIPLNSIRPLLQSLRKENHSA
ncbi:sigma factor-like helix-turn-helix DNA-binding protein [Domibacillus tundrae]|uniref:sigma factor-like helix-turn-helix DNA-binding protein n=1 Tax=Domibacillus tundrae TaxID=1587527 RepID=UPI000617B35D|nr:sigma factor-like helix-turn-helix DNA-binding protein [Domibacillus tundrae]